MIDIIISKLQTKQWRIKNFGTMNGGSGTIKPELYQRENIEKITTKKCYKTNMRFNIRNNKLVKISRPNTSMSGFDYTEDFDGESLIDNDQFYFNFKMVIGKGGSQTRSLREVYHFIEQQLKYSLINKNVYFINILEGDESYRNKDKFDYLKNLEEYKKCNNVFIGDIHMFKKWYEDFKK
jgi:hypothetical protein